MYTVLSETTETVIIALNEKTSYTLSSSAFALCKLAIAGGGSEEEVFASMATVTAKDAKVFDPEKAKRAALKVERVAALAEFEKVLANYIWSDAVLERAQSVNRLRTEQTEVEQTPLIIDLGLPYTKNAHSKGCQPGQYRFTYFKGIPTLVVGLKEPLPRAMVLQSEIDVALHAFRIACADEVDVPSVLRDENTSKHFDLNNDGNVVFTVKVNTRGSGNGGGKRRKVRELSTGVVYDSKTLHGEAFNANGTKYPHKVSEGRILAGKAEYVID